MRLAQLSHQRDLLVRFTDAVVVGAEEVEEIGEVGEVGGLEHSSTNSFRILRIIKF